MIIKVLIKKDKWILSIGKSRGFKRNSATTSYNLIERKMKSLTRNLCLPLKDKYVLKVRNDREYLNESMSSNNAHYLLFCLLCFLEDYLNKDFIKNREKILLTKIE